jgi:putative PIG3 family NAD(P)H quinone oxidoreductase
MKTTLMQAIICTAAGDTDVLQFGQIACPEPQPHQLLVRVYATALNRADILQRRGKYPPPVGESSILGLEIAGEVVAIGANVTQHKIGDHVFGLVGGGGYAQYCVIDEYLAMPIPTDWDYQTAAAVPEAFLTANETVFELGQLQTGESLLLHAAASGVGTAVIQMAKMIQAMVYATAGSDDKCAAVIALGATAAINYKITDFEKWILKQTQEQGVDVVEDFIGQTYFQKHLQVLKPGGRLIQVATMSGTQAELDLRILMSKRLQIIGSVMRSRSLADKRAITQRFQKRWWQALTTGQITPVIDSIFSWQDMAQAHQRMEANQNIGKIVIKIE